MGCLLCPKPKKDPLLLEYDEKLDIDCAYKVVDIILEKDVDTYSQFRNTIKYLKKE